MKTKLLLTIALVLGISYYHWAQSASAVSEPEYPYVEVVVTQEKIWLMPEETPLIELPVRILNASGTLVMKKVFCTDTKDWSLDVTDLPAGKYRILIGSVQTEYMEKQGRKGLL